MTAVQPAPTTTTALPALFVGAAATNAAMAAASPVATIVAGDWIGPGWGALPNTAAIVGTGAGALMLTAVIGRRGRRAGLTAGYAAALTGAVLTLLSIAAATVLGLVLGMLLLGLGNAAAQLSRYVAAEDVPVERRGVAIGIIVWAGTLGAVAGPLLLMPAGTAALGLGLAPDLGPMFLVVLACGAALLAARGLPAGTAIPSAPMAVLGRLFRNTTTGLPVLVMTTGQVVMVLVMTTVPLEMHHHGSGLGAVGAVVSAHSLGMFVLAPLTGRLVDRFGHSPVMTAGLVALAGSVLLAGASHGLVRACALFLLGYAWNLCFVGGSGALAARVTAADRHAVEGAADAVVWTTSAAASLASTLLLASAGFGTLTVIGAALVTPAAALAVSGRRRGWPWPVGVERRCWRSSQRAASERRGTGCGIPRTPPPDPCRPQAPTKQPAHL